MPSAGPVRGGRPHRGSRGMTDQEHRLTRGAHQVERGGDVVRFARRWRQRTRGIAVVAHAEQAFEPICAPTRGLPARLPPARADQALSRLRAMTTRWIWLVPS